MTGKFHLKSGIYEVSFGYHSKMGGYTTIMLDIQVRRHCVNENGEANA